MKFNLLKQVVNYVYKYIKVNKKIEIPFAISSHDLHLAKNQSMCKTWQGDICNEAIARIFLKPLTIAAQYLQRAQL